MDIMELGAIGELVGGVAVIGSLIFVGLQVRNNNRLARAQVHRETMDASTNIALNTDRDVIDLILQGARDLASLSEADRLLFFNRLAAVGNYFEMLFYARERGEVEDDLWTSRVRRMRNTFGVFLPAWRTHRDGFGHRFVAFVESEVFPNLNHGADYFPEDLRGPAGVQ